MSGKEKRKRPLSKSGFIAAMDCPVRLRHRRESLRTNTDHNDFMRLLAEGGIMFEHLVRHANPGAVLARGGGTGHEDHNATQHAMREILANGFGILHEPTFIAGNLMCRCDMLRIDVKTRTIELCEIKAKSIYAAADANGEFPTQVPAEVPGEDGNSQILTKNEPRILSKWVPYIADVAYQLVVLEKALKEMGEAFAGFKLKPRLVLVNKAAMGGEWDGFGNLEVIPDSLVKRKDGTWSGIDYRFKSSPPPGYRSPIVVEVDVTRPVEILFVESPTKSDYFKGKGLPELIDGMSQLWDADENAFIDILKGERSWKCRDCMYNLNEDDDGFSWCWGKTAEAARSLGTLHRGGTYADPLHGRGGDWISLRVDEGVTRVAELEPEESAGKQAARRARQMEAEHTGMVRVSEDFKDDVRRYLLPAGAESVLWFIDFETTTGCLPHYVDVGPYEILAFQYSLHAVPVRDGRPVWEETEHRKWLFGDAENGESCLELDLAFLESMQRDLEAPVAGIVDCTSPIFHWSHHEVTVLRKLRRRLTKSSTGGIDGMPESRLANAIEFIDSVISASSPRFLDMLKVATEPHVFHPLQRGRFSIKCLLPAICSEERYREVIRKLVPSLEDSDKIKDCSEGEAWDPYAGLPSLSEILGNKDAPGAVADDRDEDEEAQSEDGIRCGTDAMRAFSSLRYRVHSQGEEVGPDEVSRIREALEVYCCLDTAAMVVVWQWLVATSESE